MEEIQERKEGGTVVGPSRRGMERTGAQAQPDHSWRERGEEGKPEGAPVRWLQFS